MTEELELIDSNASTTMSHGYMDTLSSSDMLRSDTRGVCGVLERIPMIVKLIIMCFVILFGLVVLASFLLAVQGRQIRGAKASYKILRIAADLGIIIGTFQQERYEVNTFIAGRRSSQFSVNVTVLQSTLQTTAEVLQKMAGKRGIYSPDDTIVKMLDGFQKAALGFLPNVRLSLFNNTIDPISASQNYANLIDILIKVMARFVMLAGNEATSSSYHQMIRVIETEQQFRDSGMFSIIVQQMNPIFYRSLIQNMKARDDTLSHWKETVTDDLADFYNSTMSFSVMLACSTMESKLTFPRDCISCTNVTGINLASWVGNTTLKLGMLNKVKTHVADKLHTTSQKNLQKAAALIITVVILIVFFFILSMVTSVTLSCKCYVIY
jgi:hypothetical protein